MGKSYPKLKLFNIINNPHSNIISSITTFPSENIISVSYDYSIKIWDQYFNNIQTIKYAHKTFINDVYVKDEDNFVTCSYDKKIKTWIRNKKDIKREKFKLNQTIEKAHNSIINKVIYLSNENLISCSEDKTLKIWEKNINKYQLTTVLTHLLPIRSIIFLEDKNLIVSSGLDGIKLWKKHNHEIFFSLKKAICFHKNAIKRIDHDKIIIGGKDNSIVFSLKKKKIIKEIKNSFECHSICVIQDKKIFVISGQGNDLKVYNINNFKCIQIIKDAHANLILGLSNINNNCIASYGKDKTIKIWSFEF